MKVTAHTIAASDYYNQVILIKNKEWECMGYCKSGMTIKFSRIEVLQNNKLALINIYIKPYQQVHPKIIKLIWNIKS